MQTHMGILIMLIIRVQNMLCIDHDQVWISIRQCNYSGDTTLISCRRTDTRLQTFMSAGLLLYYTTSTNTAYSNVISSAQQKAEMLMACFQVSASGG